MMYWQNAVPIPGTENLPDRLAVLYAGRVPDAFRIYPVVHGKLIPTIGDTFRQAVT